MHAQKQKGYIVVEGNIGAGKSTFLSLIKKHLSVDILHEPTDAWQNINGYNVLDAFYKDPNRWAYTFQTYAFITRILAQQEKSKTSSAPLIVERSVYADRYCFAKNAYELGVMSELEWQMYTQWFTWLMDLYVEKPLGFIYLKTDPTICYQRLLKRDRSEEKAVKLDYIELLHEKYENWLVAKNDIMPGLQEVPVLVLECNAEFETDVQMQQEHIAKVINFLAEKYTISDPAFLRLGTTQSIQL